MRRVLWIAGLVVAVACSDSNGPSGVPDARLSFVRQDTLSPPLLAARDSFWAKVSDGRELKLFYQGAQPGDTGEEFLRFEVPGDGLLRRPNGAAFGPNDSILITVTAVDPARFIFDFQPAGLRFNPAHPARLRVRYLLSEKDFDGDGDEDAADDEIENLLDLWYRQAPGALWFKVGSVKFEDLDEIDANIVTFSQYAVAW